MSDAYRSALSGTLLREFPDVCIHEAQDLSSLQLQVEHNEQAHLILLDLHMPGAQGFSGLIFLVAHYPHIPVIIVSAHDQPEIIRRAMDHGASGFLPKSSGIDDMVEAIQTVLKGGVWMPKNVSMSDSSNPSEMDFAQALAQLTPQQFRVANMVSEGLLNKQIAYELGVTEATIKAHMKAMSALAVQPLHDQSTF